jgi:hypothetical protein
MTGARTADLAPEHRRIVLANLAAELPLGASARVFGSRANGRARRWCYLDLAVDAGRPLTLDELARPPRHSETATCPIASISPIGEPASTNSAG